MSAIASMDIGKSEIVDHFTADIVKMLNGWKIHESLFMKYLFRQYLMF